MPPAVCPQYNQLITYSDNSCAVSAHETSVSHSLKLTSSMFRVDVY